MSLLRWQVLSAVFLLTISFSIYLLHYILFQDMHHILVFMIGHLAFLPVEILTVTIIVDQVLKAREKRSVLIKLNMIIGIFFSKVGTTLLKKLSAFDRNMDQVGKCLIFTTDWNKRDFKQALEKIKTASYDIDSRRGNLEDLKRFMNNEMGFLLMLLGNQPLLEHETFTDLLWAITHLSEELALRDNLNKLSERDLNHLSFDIKKTYTLLLGEWLTYMWHMKNSYPQLFSLAVRTNPFNPDVSVAF